MLDCQRGLHIVFMPRMSKRDLWLLANTLFCYDLFVAIIVETTVVIITTVPCFAIIRFMMQRQPAVLDKPGAVDLHANYHKPA